MFKIDLLDILSKSKLQKNHPHLTKKAIYKVSM